MKEQQQQEQPKKKAKTIAGCANVDASGPSVPRIQFATIAAADFFARFVSQRKPCVILGHPGVPSATMLRQEMECLSNDCVVQLERRKHPGERFGQERSDVRQVSSNIATFVRDCYTHPVPEATQLLYLSTQSNPDEDTIHTAVGDDAQPPPPPFFGPPCDRLTSIPRTPLPLAGHLRLDSCHLWMGVARESHSGLHHDFHDNFYLLLSGQKTFYLYPPTDALHVGVVGDVERIHSNGLISYRDSPTHADGRPAVEREDGRGAGDDDEEEEAVVIGKGFDYQSDDEEEDGHGVSVESFSDDEATELSDDPQSEMGNNFCWIDPTLPREKILETFPNYAKAIRSLVTLQAGEVLYLPASWFHCVVSKGSSPASPVHMALNHWYTPPDNLENFQRPYTNQAYLNQGF